MWTKQVAALKHRHRVLAPDLPGFGPTGAEAGVTRPAEAAYEFPHLREGAWARSRRGTLLRWRGGGGLRPGPPWQRPQRWCWWTPHYSENAPASKPGPTCVERAKAGDLSGARKAWLRGAALRGTPAFARSFGSGANASHGQRLPWGGHWRGMLETGLGAPSAEVTSGRTSSALRWCSSVSGTRPISRRWPGTYVHEMPNAQLLELAGLGHMGPMEDPERFNRFLLEFLETHEPGTLSLPSSPRLTFGTWQPENTPLAVHLWGRCPCHLLYCGPTLHPGAGGRARKASGDGWARRCLECNTARCFIVRTEHWWAAAAFDRVRWSPASLELGFLLRPEFWGQGLATGGRPRRCDTCLRQRPRRSGAIFAGHHPKNSASQRVLQKLGFKRTHAEHYPPTGLQHPCYLLHKETFLPAGDVPRG